MIGPQDYPPEQGDEYSAKVIAPLAQGLGVACFYAHLEGDLVGVEAQHKPDVARATDGDPLTRAWEAVRAQHSAREVAATMGFEAVVT